MSETWMFHAACKVEFQHIQSVVLTADVFQFLHRIYIDFFQEDHFFPR